LPITKNLNAQLGFEIPENLGLPPVTEKEPFPIRGSQGRKYVRIEIVSPVDFRLLVLKKGKIGLSKNQFSGKILNLSCGGLLLESGEALSEGVFLLLSLNLNGVVILKGILGKTKRVEPTGDGGFLVGVEFCSREEIENLASKKQIEKLPVKVASFNNKLKEIITAHVRTAHLTTQNRKPEF
jgi:hypothetical protein